MITQFVFVYSETCSNMDVIYHIVQLAYKIVTDQKITNKWTNHIHKELDHFYKNCKKKINLLSKLVLI